MASGEMKIGGYTLWPVEMDGDSGYDGVIIADSGMESYVFLAEGTPEFDALSDLNFDDLRENIIDYFFRTAESEDRVFKIISPSEGSLGGILKVPDKKDLSQMKFSYSIDGLWESVSWKNAAIMTGVVVAGLIVIIGAAAAIAFFFPTVGIGGAMAWAGGGIGLASGLYFAESISDSWNWESPAMIDIGYEENNPFLIHQGLSSYAGGWVASAWMLAPAGIARLASIKLPKQIEGPVINMENVGGIWQAVGTRSRAIAMLPQPAPLRATKSDIAPFTFATSAQILNAAFLDTAPIPFTAGSGATVGLSKVFADDSFGPPSKAKYLLWNSEGEHIGSVELDHYGGSPRLTINANQTIDDGTVAKIANFFGVSEPPQTFDTSLEYGGLASMPAVSLRGHEVAVAISRNQSDTGGCFASLAMTTGAGMIVETPSSYLASAEDGIGDYAHPAPPKLSNPQTALPSIEALLAEHRSDAEPLFSQLEALLADEPVDPETAIGIISSLDTLYANLLSNLLRTLGTDESIVFWAVSGAEEYAPAIREFVGFLQIFSEIIVRTINALPRSGGPYEPANRALIRWRKIEADYLYRFSHDVAGSADVHMGLADTLYRSGDERAAVDNYKIAAMNYELAASPSSMQRQRPAETGILLVRSIHARADIMRTIIGTGDITPSTGNELFHIMKTLGNALNLLRETEDHQILSEAINTTAKIARTLLEPLTASGNYDVVRRFHPTRIAMYFAQYLMDLARQTIRLADSAHSKVGLLERPDLNTAYVDESLGSLSTYERLAQAGALASDSAIHSMEIWLPVMTTAGEDLEAVNLLVEMARIKMWQANKIWLSARTRPGDISTERVRDAARADYIRAEQVLMRTGFWDDIIRAMEKTDVRYVDQDGNALYTLEAFLRHHYTIKFSAALAAVIARSTGNSLEATRLSQICERLDYMGERLVVSAPSTNVSDLPTAGDVSKWGLDKGYLIVHVVKGQQQSTPTKLILQGALEWLAVSQETLDYLMNGR